MKSDGAHACHLDILIRVKIMKPGDIFISGTLLATSNLLLVCLRLHPGCQNRSHLRILQYHATARNMSTVRIDTLFGK